VDIAADDFELPGLYRDDEITMAGKPACRQVIVNDRPAAAPIADQVAALRCVGFHPLGRQRGAGLDAEAMATCSIDVVGMGFGIWEAVSRSGDPHDIRREGGRPGVVPVLALRKNLTVFIVDAGPILLSPVRIEAEPPIFAD